MGLPHLQRSVIQHFYPYLSSTILSVMEHRVIDSLDPMVGVISLVHTTIFWWWSLFMRSCSLWIWLYFKKLIKEEKDRFYLMVMLEDWMHLVYRFKLICQQIVLRFCAIIFVVYLFISHPVWWDII